MLPSLVNQNAERLAVPLADIFNCAFKEERWPDIWKAESVTIIPKKPKPETLNETRNISCTPLFSKVLEYFVLEKLKEVCGPKRNQ